MSKNAVQPGDRWQRLWSYIQEKDPYAEIQIGETPNEVSILWSVGTQVELCWVALSGDQPQIMGWRPSHECNSQRTHEKG